MSRVRTADGVCRTTPLAHADVTAAFDVLKEHPDAEIILSSALDALAALGWRGRLEEHVRASLTWRAALARCNAECEPA